jgi:hypothetical protein
MSVPSESIEVGKCYLADGRAHPHPSLKTYLCRSSLCTQSHFYVGGCKRDFCGGNITKQFHHLAGQLGILLQALLGCPRLLFRLLLASPAGLLCLNQAPEGYFQGLPPP